MISPGKLFVLEFHLLSPTLIVLVDMRRTPHITLYIVQQCTDCFFRVMMIVCTSLMSIDMRTCVSTDYIQTIQPNGNIYKDSLENTGGMSE